MLIVDYNELDVRGAQTVLAHAGSRVGDPRTSSEMRERLPRRPWSAVLLDVGAFAGQVRTSIDASGPAHGAPGEHDRDAPRS